MKDEKPLDPASSLDEQEAPLEVTAPTWVLPILSNHNAVRPIGQIRLQKEGLMVEFLPGSEPTEEQFLATFGNIGYQLGRTLHPDGVPTRIQSATIHEFSVPAA